MKTVFALLVAVAAAAALAQRAKPAAEPTKPAAEAPQAATPAAQDTKPAPKRTARKATARRHMDARHCLEKPNNTEIIKCAEAYL